MNKFIALLRGINVGGHRKIKMTDLRALLHEQNFENVQTYIQSGNIVFLSTQSKEACAQKIATGIKERFDFTVPIILVTLEDLRSIVQNFPFSKQKQKDSYYTLLSKTPDPKLSLDFKSVSFSEEEILLQGNCVYFYTAKGMAKVKYSNNLAEKKLNVSATTRNHRTLQKLLEMAQDV